MICAVIGGCGFIGGHVVTALRNAGFQVIAIDSAPHADCKLDICDTANIEQALRANNVDYVFHLAAIADARETLAHPVRAVQINVGGTASVFEAARKTQVKRVILASTCWVAGAMGSGMIDENTAFSPNGAGHIYTTTKIASELLAHDYHALYGLPFTILRYGIPYGPGMWSGLVLRAFLNSAAQGKALTIFGDGSASRRFLYVKDLAEAHVLVLNEVATNQTYNLEGMRSVSTRELAETVSRMLGGLEIRYQQEPERIGEFQYFRKLISSTKAYLELGWEPKVDLETGIRQAITWYHHNIHPLPGVEPLILADAAKKEPL